MQDLHPHLNGPQAHTRATDSVIYVSATSNGHVEVAAGWPDLNGGVIE